MIAIYRAGNESFFKTVLGFFFIDPLQCRENKTSFVFMMFVGSGYDLRVGRNGMMPKRWSTKTNLISKMEILYRHRRRTGAGRSSAWKWLMKTNACSRRMCWPRATRSSVYNTAATREHHRPAWHPMALRGKSFLTVRFATFYSRGSASSGPVLQSLSLWCKTTRISLPIRAEFSRASSWLVQKCCAGEIETRPRLTSLPSEAFCK